MNITLTPEQWQRAKAAASAQSATMITDKGEAVQNGVLFAWEYVEPTLNIEVKKKPWYVPMAKIESTIRERLQVI